MALCADPVNSSPRRNCFRKGTTASQAAASISNLQFSDSLEVPREQQGTRRLVDSYLIPDPEQPRKEFDEKELTNLNDVVLLSGVSAGPTPTRGFNGFRPPTLPRARAAANPAFVRSTIRAFELSQRREDAKD